MFLFHASNLGVFLFLHIQSCQLPIHCPNEGVHQKNVLHAWNKITRRAGTVIVMNKASASVITRISIKLMCHMDDTILTFEVKTYTFTCDLALFTHLPVI